LTELRRTSLLGLASVLRYYATGGEVRNVNGIKLLLTTRLVANSAARGFVDSLKLNQNDLSFLAEQMALDDAGFERALASDGGR
jgi:hypothetical protein